MTFNDLGNLRRSSVVMTFGPGAIVDFRSDKAPVSAVIAGLDEWDTNFGPPGLANPQQISEPRLEHELKVRGFRLPPVADEDWESMKGSPDNRALVAVRFPDWLQCPQCDRIAPSSKWSGDAGRGYRYCPKCTAKAPGQHKVFVVPVRFIMACEDGHIDEFPWHFWVGHEPDCKNKKQFGFLELKAIQPGLAGLIVSCPECGAYRSLDGIFNVDTWAGFRCNGRRPWLAVENQICDKQPRVLQRGASNLYFPVIKSALNIPPWSDRLQEALGIYWSSIINLRDSSRRAQFIEMLSESNPDLRHVMDELQLGPIELAKRIDERIALLNSIEVTGILQEEYRQFNSKEDVQREDREFEVRSVKVPEILAAYFSNIVRVVRLREVRALRGFTRIYPPDTNNENQISSISTRKMDWLPAIEVRGEGIFLSFNISPLSNWENNEEIQKRATKINQSLRKEWKARYGEGTPPRIITPRFVLVHTFSHALMRQLTLECGYSSASLRERLYVSEGKDGMAGVLIYTSTSDSDGTLGGLQRQGESHRIERAIPAAIKAMEWCSSDPLCINGMVAAEESHSFASCHACCLAPETACEEYNRFLDRALLVGTPENSDIGYFIDILKED